MTHHFKILSHPIRIEILNILKNRGPYVCDITKLVKKTQPHISRNLTVLKQAALVAYEKKGTRIFYMFIYGLIFFKQKPTIFPQLILFLDFNNIFVSIYGYK